jgi:phosphoglycolate phosphatase-like HAD superfamily hydrolase
MIRHLLWDLDGTLFDTYPAITYAISKSINQMGGTVALNVIDELARQSIGHCLETLATRFRFNPNLLQSRYTENYRELSPANQPPFPGGRETCAFVRQNDGRNLIVTHRELESCHILLETHEMSALFDDIFSTEQGYLRKPSPEMVLAALSKYDLNPAETLMVGDRALDIQAGQAAGVRTCLFGTDSLSVAADFHVQHLSEILGQIIPGTT